MTVSLASPEQGPAGERPSSAASRPRIVVDGVFFQYASSGIARVWIALLEEWAKSGFIANVVFLDRGGAPEVAGLRSETFPAHDYARTGADSLALERACRDLGADLFVSTYYTTPTATPSFFFGYDMIPEMVGADLTREVWREKRRAILHASARFMISANSAHDLERIYGLPEGSTCVAHCGVWRSFYRPPPDEIAALRQKYGLPEQPYVLMVGERVGIDGYKNGELAFRAMARLPDPSRFTLVCVGGSALIEQHLAAAAPNVSVVRLALGDDELRAVYAGAHAFLCPSRYEGFGMPVAEAMACGAPVITCRNSSIAEVAGDAALFVGEDDPQGMADAIARLCDPAVREDIIARGVAQAARFSFADMAHEVAGALAGVHRRLSCGELRRPDGVWQELREMQQTSQSPRVVGVVLRQEVRRRTLGLLRRIAGDPSRSRLWATAREIQRDPARWIATAGGLLQKGGRLRKGARRLR